ncbi:MAG TPA: arsenate reductase ArsC [Armatimonadota bacterium]|nr:arsenate reductase ArsC [Armatimonadota bacterium]
MLVMFVCVHNAGRSQMAEAFCNALAPVWLHAVSAGTVPAEQVNQVVVDAMAEIGIDMSNHTPKLATPELVAQSDRIITMGCGVQESCPLYLGIRIDEDWGLPDPASQGIESVRVIRDAVRERILDFLARIQPEEQ